MTSDVLCVTVIHSQDGWDVTYTDTHICAFKGSTVEIHCSYIHPPGTRVTETFWFTKMKAGEYVKLKDDPKYARRVEYSEKSCSLTIRSLRESDSAEYKFMLITNQQDGKYSGSPGVTLSVTGNVFTGSRSESTY